MYEDTVSLPGHPYLTQVKNKEALFHLPVVFVSAIITISIFRVDKSDNHLIQESILSLND